jgi:hypothetical protein
MGLRSCQGQHFPINGTPEQLSEKLPIPEMFDELSMAAAKYGVLSLAQVMIVRYG